METLKSRRNFLKTSAAGLAGVGYHLSHPFDRRLAFAAPSEQPVVAFAGCGIRFHTALARQAVEYGPCAAICDVDALQLGCAKQIIRAHCDGNGRPLVFDTHDDYRRILDRKDVDVVVIATPDHWHTKIAIEAMQAGKDVYCEKPLTLTIREGQQLLQVQKATQRVLQVGTQQRTEYDQMFAKAVALVRHGRVGQVKKVTCGLGGTRECDVLPVVNPPKYINWDKWLGQAPMTDYREGAILDQAGWGSGFPFSRTHRYFRWWYEYSGGKLTDWGAHHVDTALWALDKLHQDIGMFTVEPLTVEHPVPFVDGMPTVNDRFNTATRYTVRIRFADGIELFIRDTAEEDLGFESGTMFEGTKGRFLVNRGKLVGKPVEDLEHDPLPDRAILDLYGGKIPAGHMDNFMECVKTRQQPVSDLESHHRMLSVCHVVNIAMRLNRKLTYDPKTESFPYDAQANSFVEREQRKGYEIRV
jgi:predicted dehydrogenase